jgi:pyruvate,water dikinase
VIPEHAVIDLADIRIADIGRVGPKVARLGQLAGGGWRVPDGYAVTSAALGAWLPADVRGEADALLDAGQGGQARDLIEAQPLPDWLAAAIAEAHERLAARTGKGAALAVAVRSSALSEDGASASFAGQYATYLGIRGVPDVLRHVSKCWASGFSDHAMDYRRRVGAASPEAPSQGGAGHLARHSLAVGVLELVDVRSAGVVFTADPVSGDRDRLVVEANWGFGESVVSGQVTPDHWEVDRATGHILAEHVTAKGTWSAVDPATGAVRPQPLPAELAAQQCLAPHEVRYLCRQAVAIEDAASLEGTGPGGQGTAQDVEWAIARGLPFPDSVYILQHRPVTTLAAPEEPPRAVPPPEPAFDPVQYALRNVFRVPGT